jgi:hypothetical protein
MYYLQFLLLLLLLLLDTYRNDPASFDGNVICLAKILKNVTCEEGCLLSDENV